MMRSSWRLPLLVLLVVATAGSQRSWAEEEAATEEAPAGAEASRSDVPVRSALSRFLLDVYDKAGGFQGLPGIGEGQGRPRTPERPKEGGGRPPSGTPPIEGLPGIGGGPPRPGPGIPGLTMPRRQDRPYLVECLEFEDEASCDAWVQRFLRLEGAGVLAKRGPFVDVLRPAGHDVGGRTATRARGLRWSEPLGQVLVPPPVPVTASEAEGTRGRPLPTVRGGFREEGGSHWTGRGVLLAVLDDGVDFLHPDFVIEDDGGLPRSRILWYWDVYGVPGRDGPEVDGRTVLPGPATWPDGSPIGVVYTRAALNRALRADTRRQAPPIRDYLAGPHGTLCTSTAAGNGRGRPVEGQRFGQHAGVAPEADLIAVRIFPGNDQQGDRGYLLNAIASWLTAKAEERGAPLVVSCSWGRDMHGHDGASVSERHLESLFPLEAKGRALCVAAGNRGADEWHASLQLTGRFEDGKLEWMAVSPDFAVLSLYVETSDMDDVTWQPLRQGARVSRVSEEVRQVNPLTGHTEMVFAIPQDGPGGIALRSKSGTKHRVHAYLYGHGVVPDRSGRPQLVRSRFQEGYAQSSHLLDAPACCRTAITVGSYDFNDAVPCGRRNGDVVYRELLTKLTEGEALRLGRVSYYSSPGPLRTGAVKPEVVAPGTFHLSAFPVSRDDDVGWRFIPAPGRQCAVVEQLGIVLTADRRYAAWAGTSSAAPYVAGVVALMLQKNPDLTLREIRALLDASLTRERLKGNAAAWGRGRLDLPAVRRLFASIPEAH